jgi:hypothetical protein
MIAWWRIFRGGLGVGREDFRAFWTWRTWLFGWLARILTSAAIWVLLGRMTGAPGQAEYLLVGNAAVAGRLVSNYERIDFEGPATVAGRIGALAGVVVRAAAAGCYRVEIAEPGAAGRVLGELVAAGVTNLQTSRPSLEEVYIHLIGDRGLRV